MGAKFGNSLSAFPGRKTTISQELGGCEFHQYPSSERQARCEEGILLAVRSVGIPNQWSLGSLDSSEWLILKDQLGTKFLACASR